ncbi:MAG: winged helix-turn-helix transcriptional regulator [Candidatus Nanohaloarchaea archaeon]
MATRDVIEEEVRENPGIAFTELKERTSLSNGVVQYHVQKSDCLERKKGAILPEGGCEDCEYRDLCEDVCLKKVMRDSRNQKIVEMMEEGRKQVEIAEELGLDRSTVNYHVKKLESLGLLEV